MKSHPEPSPAIAEHAHGSVLSISVLPRTSKIGIERLADGTLRVRLTAPPVDGAANAALLRYLADVLDVPRSRLSIVAGETSRRKRVAVAGLTAPAVEKQIQDALDRTS